MEGACGAHQGAMLLSHLGRGNEEATGRTGAQKFDPAYPTNVFPYHVSQDVPVDVERRGAVDCGIGLGLAPAIRVFEVPVPLDGVLGLDVIRGGHVGGEGR
jgi:hypothetical protein